MCLLGSALLSTLIIFSLSVFYFVNRAESTSWRGRQSEAARSAAATISGFIQRVEDALRVVGTVEPDHLASDPKELDTLLMQNQSLLEIIRLDDSGHVLASTSRDKGVLANLIPIPQSPWFTQASAGQTFIGDVQLSAHDLPYIIMAVPSADKGVIASRVEMNVLWTVVQNIQFGRSGRAYVVTHTGQVIAHTDPGIILHNTNIRKQPEFGSIVAAPNNEWSGTYVNFEGKHVVGYSISIPGTNWLVIAELPLSEAFATTQMALYVLGAEALLLMFFASWIVARYVRFLVVKPIEQLKNGAERIGHGELDHRIGAGLKNEIGQLALAFDTMASSLQQHNAQVEAQTMALQISEARYRAIVEDQTELVCRFMPDGTLTFVNEAYCRYFDKSRDDLIGKSFMPLIPKEEQPNVEAMMASLNASKPVVSYEHRVIMSDGSLRWQYWTDRVILSEWGQVVEVASVGRDITEKKLAEDKLRLLNMELENHVRERTSDLILEIAERKRIESALRESEERYSVAVLGANDGLWDWDLKTNEIYFSSRWKAMLGFRDDEISNNPDEWFGRIHPQDKDQVRNALNHHCNGDTGHFEIEYRMRHADGSDRWVLSRGLAVRDANGMASRMAGSQTDITERKLAEERLAHNALHDALTGLPNRILLMDRLQQMLEHNKRNPAQLFAVLFLDLDRFKVINDSLGHLIGDKFLIAIAHIIQSCLRPEDTISRMGGDEFAILVDNISDISDAIRITERIRSRLMSATLLGVVNRTTTVSIGIALCKGNYSYPQDILRDADTAMYRAKAQGGDRYQIFDTVMYANALHLMQLEADLKQAVENQEWQVYYQPILSLMTGEIVGVEALVRWLHPQRGIVSPLEFIPLAEETGLILPIGEYVLEAACAQIKVWHDAGHSNLWGSVNISARQFQDQNLLKMVEQTLIKTGLPSAALRLEITESVAMKDLSHSVRTLKDLSALGIHAALDDFGNGYSSLSYLKRLPLKVLKIDRSFIQDLKIDKNSEAITAAIISMGHTLDLEVVAEGVENEEQLAFLRSKLCDKLQGYFFGEPMPAEKITQMLKTRSYNLIPIPQLV
jgi:diguanylate cyclase (GGDEF)-like protein/PAS domain S-box-containing protein